MFDSSGVIVVKYVYDAWGNHEVIILDGTAEDAKTTHIGNLNPYRYRGYYYDVETGLYYLKTRYYDPEVGRFITVDDISYLDPETINGLNLYAYCGNNPVMNVDPSGRFALTALFIGFLIGLGVGAVAGGAVAYTAAKSNGASGWALFGYTLAGIFGGAAIGGAAGALIGYIAPAIGGFLGTSFTVGSYVTAAGELAAVTVTGAQILKGIGAVAAGLGILFASTNRPGDNRRQNEQYREAMKRLGYDKKDWQWRYGHDHLPNKSLGFKNLLEFLKSLFKKFK